MPLAVNLIICLICGGIAAAIASGKGRSVVGWFFGGFFLGLIGIIIVACLANLNEQRNYRRQVEQSNHRLREQLRQERMKGEAFRQHSMSRLDAHDQALGVDTRTLGPMLGAEPSPAQLAGERPEDALSRLAGDTQEPQTVRVGQLGGSEAQTEQFQPDVDGDQSTLSWYFANAGQSYGPVSAVRILEMLREQSLHLDSLLWSEGMADWRPAREVAIFRDAVNL